MDARAGNPGRSAGRLFRRAAYGRLYGATRHDARAPAPPARPLPDGRLPAPAAAAPVQERARITPAATAARRGSPVEILTVARDHC